MLHKQKTKRFYQEILPLGITNKQREPWQIAELTQQSSLFEAYICNELIATDIFRNV